MRQISMIALCAGVALCMGMVGCMPTGGSTSGTKIALDDVNHIVKGRTTRAQLEARLGPPNYVSMMGDGRRMLVYSYIDMGVSGTFIPFVTGMNVNSRQQSLQVILSKNNVVQDYEFSDKTTGTTGGSVGMYSHYNATTINTPADGR